MTALANFERNYADVERLFEVHGALTEGVQGRNRHLTPAILKASVVLTCAAWEAFVEDLCNESAALIARDLTDPARLPTGAQKRIINRLTSDRHELAHWRISGEGWKQLYIDEVACLCDGLLGGLNTPNSRNVRELYSDTLGIRDVTSSWQWQRMTPDQAVRKLNALVALRGSLAHGRGEAGLNIGTARGHAGHIQRLVGLLQNEVEGAVRELTR